jgi:CubicO group peptidase (beta-lactamase class C family)
MDPVKLQAALDQVTEQRIALESLLIIRNGAIVSETYYNGSDQDTPHALFSVTKSFIATLVGIAFDQGELNGLDQPVLALLPGRSYANLDDRKEVLSIEDVLTMSTGLEWIEGDPAYRELYMGRDWVKNLLDRPVTEKPGERFNYCSGCAHLLSAILQEQTGMPTRKFADKYLFKPLGITELRWEEDAQHIAIGGWGLSLTPRDMARLGYLYLQQGQWDGEQILSPGWIEAATTKHLPAGDRLDYGYQWWIHREIPAYMALGRGGQTIFVAPELDLIVVTTANLNGGHDPILDLIDDYIIPAAQ